jgi:hypothetical protein
LIFIFLFPISFFFFFVKINITLFNNKSQIRKKKSFFNLKIVKNI